MGDDPVVLKQADDDYANLLTQLDDLDKRLAAIADDIAIT